MSDDRTIKNHHVVTTTHELRIDGHHLIEKKQRTMDQYIAITVILVVIRSIDDKSYQATDTYPTYSGTGKAANRPCPLFRYRQPGLIERQVETDMAEDEVK